MSLAKRRREISIQQGDLFRQLAEPAPCGREQVDLDLGDELRGAIAGAIRRARQRGLSRERIIDGMNLRLPDLPRPITRRQLDAWTAASKEHHEFPVRYLPAFCATVDDISPLTLVLGVLGYDVVDARDQKALRLGELTVQQAALSREARRIKSELGG